MSRNICHKNIIFLNRIWFIANLVVWIYCKNRFLYFFLSNWIKLTPPNLSSKYAHIIYKNGVIFART